MSKKPLVKVTDLFADSDEEQVQEPERIEKSIKLPGLQAALPKNEPISTETNEEAWLAQNLIVKCVNGTLAAGKYTNKLGVIQRVVEAGYGGEIRMIDSLDIILLDQDDCRTTLPPTGSLVRIVKGTYKKGLGRLAEINQRDVVLEMEEPREMRGRSLALEHDQICNFMP